MKKYAIFMFAALMLLASSVKAQENKEKKAKGPGIEVRVEKMATDLGLNDAEKASVKNLLEKQDAEKKELSKSIDKESPDFKPKMKEMQKKHNEELKAILGEDKFQKFQAIRAEEKMKEKK